MPRRAWKKRDRVDRGDDPSDRRPNDADDHSTVASESRLNLSRPRGRAHGNSAENSANGQVVGATATDGSATTAPTTQRPTVRCCDCSRQSTCATVGDGRGHGCACRRATPARQCTSCVNYACCTNRAGTPHGSRIPQATLTASRASLVTHFGPKGSKTSRPTTTHTRQSGRTTGSTTTTTARDAADDVPPPPPRIADDADDTTEMMETPTTAMLPKKRNMTTSSPPHLPPADTVTMTAAMTQRTTTAKKPTSPMQTTTTKTLTTTTMTTENTTATATAPTNSKKTDSAMALMTPPATMTLATTNTKATPTTTLSPPSQRTNDAPPPKRVRFSNSIPTTDDANTPMALPPPTPKLATIWDTRQDGSDIGNTHIPSPTQLTDDSDTLLSERCDPTTSLPTELSDTHPSATNFGTHLASPAIENHSTGTPTPLTPLTPTEQSTWTPSDTPDTASQTSTATSTASDSGTHPETEANHDETQASSHDSPPLPSVTENEADLSDFHTTEADRRLDAVLGDHPHHNPGTHMSGGIADDHMWQRRWRRVVQLHTKHYTVPRGHVGRRFINTLSQEFQGVRERKWNSERPLVFASVILQTRPGCRKARDIRRRLTERLDLWDRGLIASLINDLEAEVTGRARPTRQPNPEQDDRRFTAQVLSGRLRSAVRNATRAESGGVLEPTEMCTKTGQPVLDVLKAKHPDMREVDLTQPDCMAFESYPSLPAPIPLTITAEDVELVAAKLSGAAGPSGTDAVDLRTWLLRFGSTSEKFRSEMAAWTEWLANTSPPWAAYRALMAGRLVALDKQPGVRPLGIGEIFRRLIAKCVLKIIGHQSTEACGNLNLCAGLRAGMEGAIHSMNHIWDTAADTGTGSQKEPSVPSDVASDIGSPSLDLTTDTDMDTQPPDDVPPTAPPPAPDPPSTQPDTTPASMAAPGPQSPSAVLLVDARNGFNELSRRAMLWTVRHRWANGSRFAFNCYRHSTQLIARRYGAPCHILLSKEGVTQGDPLSMHLYGLALVPLAEHLRATVPSTLQPWYADDLGIGGPTDGIVATMRLLLRHGPDRGYFPEPEKSILICHPTNRPVVHAALAEFNFRHHDGHRYLGGFVGTESALADWLQPKIQQWVDGVNTLARIARKFPQAAYAGLSKSLQHEWQFLQRVIPAVADSFAPVEEAISTTFLPALLSEPDAVEPALRSLMSLPIRHAGLGISRPNDTAEDCHTASVECTAALCYSLLQRSDISARAHSQSIAEQGSAVSKRRNHAASTTLQQLSAVAPPSDARRMHRATSTGAWLSSTPEHSNGTVLSTEEFRDSLRMRYGRLPTNLPPKCDGCGARFTTEHALTCKTGGLVMIRHNDVKSEWHHLCALATSPSAVTDEPYIHSSQSEGHSAPHGQPIDPELRGDVAVHGFWRRGMTGIFDIRVSDTDAPSYRGMDPIKALTRQEREKKSKYLAPCQERRRHFTPLVFSVDGLMGPEATAATKRLATLLAGKWGKPYSEICGFLRARLSVALVRATSLCIRGSRDPTGKTPTAQLESGSGILLYS